MSEHKRRRDEEGDNHEVMRSADVSDEQIKALDAIGSEQERAELTIELETHKLLQPIFDRRRKVLAEIHSFWPLAFRNHANVFAHLQNEEDQDAMSYLKDVYVDRDGTDPRVFTIEFHFEENPYFADAVLKKEFRLYKHAGAEADGPHPDGVTQAMLEFKWERDIEEQTIKIGWKDDSKNLTKKYPKAVPKQGNDEDAEEMMIVDRYGSFFHFFEVLQTDGDTDLAHFIADDLYPNAPDYFVGQGKSSIFFNNDSDESDEDSEDDDDDASEIDLEKPRPKKRKI